MESTALAVVRSSYLIDQSYVVIHLFDIGGNAVSILGRSIGMHGNPLWQTWCYRSVLRLRFRTASSHHSFRDSPVHHVLWHYSRLNVESHVHNLSIIPLFWSINELMSGRPQRPCYYHWPPGRIMLRPHDLMNKCTATVKMFCGCICKNKHCMMPSMENDRHTLLVTTGLLHGMALRTLGFEDLFSGLGVPLGCLSERRHGAG